MNTKVTFIKPLDVNLHYICLAILIFLTTCLNAQNQYNLELNNIKKLSEYNTEKVYLHFDRTIFSPGEDIWFKAYLLEGTYHTLTSSSNNLHVDLIAPNGDIKTSQIVFMHEGAGYGDIKITPDEFEDGIYVLRAYTNFMRNFNDALFFKQNIIITGNNEIRKNQTNSEDIVDLQFFPEGGQLVYNVLNRVAFKATDQNGNGKNVSFTVFDNKNNEIQKTETVHNGMGQFMFTPQPNTSYHAILNTPGSEQQKIKLPRTSSSYSIFVGNQFKNLLDFNICTSPENVNGQEVSYIIQSHGKLFASSSFKMNRNTKLVRIAKEKLPAGISSITIFDNKGIPVCERLIYNQISPKINIDVSINKQIYKAREKVTLCIKAKDETGKPIQANLSLAVIGKHISDKQKEMLPNNSTILSSVLLCSDLKGYIENPDFYFNDFDKKKHQYLDLVLLTHGWRKYIWKEKVASTDLAMNYNYENGFNFTGTSRIQNKRPKPNSKVSLRLGDGNLYSHETDTDEKGRFSFQNIHFSDSTKLTFQAYKQKDRQNTIIRLDDSKYNAPRTASNKQNPGKKKETETNEIAVKAQKIKEIQELLATKNNKVLDEVTVKAKRNKKDEHFRLYGTADQVIKVDEKYAGHNDIFEILRRNIPMAVYFGHCPNIRVVLNARKAADKKLSSFYATYMLDGFFVEAGEICSVPPAIVDKIEILSHRKAAILGDIAKNGVIAVYTKQKQDIRWDYAPTEITSIRPQGYYRSREFYAPNYEVAQEQFEGADYRNTLHWEPFITTGEDGKAELSFFNSDDTGNYNITIEGVGLNGGLGKAETNYTVKPVNFLNN